MAPTPYSPQLLQRVLDLDQHEVAKAVTIVRKGRALRNLLGAVPIIGGGILPSEKMSAVDVAFFLAQPGHGRTIVRAHKNQVIFSQGDPADSVFYVQQGQLRASVVSDEGKEAIFSSLLGPGEFFGHKCLAGQLRRAWTVKAMTDGVLVRIEKATMLRLIQEHPALSQQFMAHILKHTIRVEANLVDQYFNSCERRLARLLLQLADHGKDGTDLETITVKITQETLAEMIGTTRPRVSFFMNRFRRLGYIDYDRHIHVRKSLVSVLTHEQRHLRD